MQPITMFVTLALLGFGALIAIGVQRYRRRSPGRGWGWERIVLASLVWVLVTVLAGSPLGLLVFIVAHDGRTANPWAAAPLLLLALPAYAVAEVLLCRWAARPGPRQPATNMMKSRS